jgi:hypothetical protein
MESEIADVGMLALEDAESGELIWLDTSDPAWRDRFARHSNQFEATKQRTLAGAGVDRVRIQTDQDYAKALTIFFQKRNKRIRH